MELIPAADNSLAKVEFRQKVLAAENWMLHARAEITSEPIDNNYPLEHYFAPIDPKYGCGTYARKIFLPKGSVVIGKIHKHQHLNFIMQGKVSVATEFGKKHFEAPAIFVSEVGLKRMVLAETDAIWVTVHLTEHSGAENLDKIEDEVISKTYDELGLIDSVEQLQIGERKE